MTIHGKSTKTTKLIKRKQTTCFAGGQFQNGYACIHLFLGLGLKTIGVGAFCIPMGCTPFKPPSLVVVVDFDYDSLKTGKIPDFLRSEIGVDYQTLRKAVELYLSGWRYIMPIPKSPQATWGNYDRRTTWFNGYWHNEKTNQYSSSEPTKHDNGEYLGDYQNQSNTWRNGGSPPTPTKSEWLLSKTDGIKP